MENSYHHIAHQLLKNEKSKNYGIYLSDEDQSQEKLNNEQFEQVYELLKDKYIVIHRLFGKANFVNICYEYFRYNPVQSSKKQNYGRTFPEFLDSMSEVEEHSFVPWLAKLDWFWTNCRELNEEIKLPKGTLNSWASVYKDQDEIDIAIDSRISETLAIKKVGNEYSIVVL
ncbi:MAG: hypothetical protein ACJAS4_001819 [Bacteriovoracaceae bacterium]|jgi:hypothetical protein